MSDRMVEAMPPNIDGMYLHGFHRTTACGLLEQEHAVAAMADDTCHFRRERGRSR
jgi:hypothetical protein